MIVDEPTNYIKRALLVYVSSVLINFMDTVVTYTCYTACIHAPFSFLFFFFEFLSLQFIQKYGNKNDKILDYAKNNLFNNPCRSSKSVNGSKSSSLDSF